MRTIARLLLLASVIGVLIACDPVDVAEKQLKKVVGSGPLVKQTRKVTAFKEIELGGPFQVAISSGEPSVEVEAQGNLQDIIKVEVDGDRLTVRLEGNSETSKPMRLKIQTPELSALKASAGCEVQANGFAPDTFRLELTSASQAKLDLKTKEMTVSLGSAAQADITGKAESINAEVSSAAQLRASKLTAQRAQVKVSSGGLAEVHADAELTGEVSSGATVKHSGKAEPQIQTSSGGEVNRA